MEFEDLRKIPSNGYPLLDGLLSMFTGYCASSNGQGLLPSLPVLKGHFKATDDKGQLADGE